MRIIIEKAASGTLWVYAKDASHNLWEVTRADDCLFLCRAHYGIEGKIVADGPATPGKCTFIFQNKVNRPDIVGALGQLIREGHKVVIWPDDVRTHGNIFEGFRDDMGHDGFDELVAGNTFTGQEAAERLANSKVVTTPVTFDRGLGNDDHALWSSELASAQ